MRLTLLGCAVAIATLATASAQAQGLYSGYGQPKYSGPGYNMPMDPHTRNGISEARRLDRENAARWRQSEREQRYLQRQNDLANPYSRRRY